MKFTFPALFSALACIFVLAHSQNIPSMEGYVSEVSNHADLESAVTAATSDTLGQLRAFQETYNKYADNLDLAKSAESSRKIQNDSPVSRKTSVNPMGYQAEYTAAGRRKLTGSFTCSPAFAAFSPWSMCSDVVDYPFLLLDTDTLQDLETAVRAAVPSTHAFMDNACLSDYKRMICAQVYLPCVDGGKSPPSPRSFPLSCLLSVSFLISIFVL